MQQSRQIQNCPGHCGCVHQCMSQSGSMWMLTQGPITSWRAQGREVQRQQPSSPAAQHPSQGPCLHLASLPFLFPTKAKWKQSGFASKAPLPSGSKWFHPCDGEGKRGVSPIVSRGLALFCCSHGVLRN